MTAQLIMGVDPGTIVAGYAIISVSHRYQIKAHSYGLIKMPAKLALAKRYRHLFETTQEVVHNVKPSAVVLETQYIHKNPNSALKLGMSRGVMLLAATLDDIPVFEYAPTSAKKAVVGSGSASKGQVQLMVSKMLGLPDLIGTQYADITDAFALAICHAHKTQYNQKLMGIL